MVDSRSVITVNVLDGTFNARETPDAIDKTNDHEIVLGEYGGSILLLFHLSAATAADTITIVAGTEEPAFRRVVCRNFCNLDSPVIPHIFNPYP